MRAENFSDADTSVKKHSSASLNSVNLFVLQIFKIFKFSESEIYKSQILKY